MQKDGLNNSYNREGYKISSNIVILRKNSSGLVNACPVSDTVLLGSRKYHLQKSNNLHSDLRKNTEWKLCKLTLNEEKPSRAVTLSCDSSLRSLVTILCILFSFGGIYLIVKHKEL